MDLTSGPVSSPSRRYSSSRTFSRRTYHGSRCSSSKRSWGSSTSARSGLPNRTPYVVSKVAIEGLTRNLARELGPFNIRCNSLLPGSMENERNRTMMREKAAREGITYEQALAQRLEFISMRTRIDPAEVGDMAVFLASDGARHVSGQQISVCGNIEWEG